MLKINYPTLIFYGVLILYKILLEVLYTNFISTIFQYAGFLYETNLTLIITSWLLYLPLLFTLKSQHHKPSEFFLFIYFVLIITPMIVLMELGGKSLTFLTYTVISFLLIKIILVTPNLKIPNVKHGNTLVLVITILMISLTFLMFFLTGGISKINFELSRIYELRDETASIYFGGIWGYITPWTVKIFIPFLLSLSLFNKKFILTLMLIAVQVIIFGITGHRSMALFSIVAIGIYLTRNKSNKNLYLILAISISLLLIYLVHIIYDDIIISSTIIRRAFFLPSFLNYSYFEYFSNNEYIYYSNSFLSWLNDYTYGDIKLSHVIAGQVLGLPEMGANTGFIGSSFAHGGFIGMGIVSILVGIVFKLIDSACSSESHTSFYISFTSIPLLAMLTSAAFFTSLLTQGVLLLILITWLYEFEDPAKKPKK